MILKKIWREIVEFFYQPSKSKWVTDEQIFKDDLDELDEKCPGWDRECKIANVRHSLEKGMLSRKTLVTIYGEEIVKKAEEQMASSQKLLSEFSSTDDEFYEMDKNNPGWDSEAVIATVRYFLGMGISRETLAFAYGEKIVKKAEE